MALSTYQELVCRVAFLAATIGWGWVVTRRQTLMKTLHSYMIMSTVLMLASWFGMLWLADLTGHSAELVNVYVSTAHCVLAVGIGWGYIYEPNWDWKKLNSKRPWADVFCCFSLSYMIWDISTIFMFYGFRGWFDEILFHHLLCIGGLLHVLMCDRYQVALSNTITMFETTGPFFNAVIYLHETGISATWPMLFVVTNVLLVLTFTYFRMFMGLPYTYKFLSHPSATYGPAFSLKAICFTFVGLSVYWYCVIMGKAFNFLASGSIDLPEQH